MLPEEAQTENAPPCSLPSAATPERPDFQISADTPLSEDVALGFIKNDDLTAEQLEQISKHTAVLKSRKVRLALAAHPRTPRRLALRLVRELYTFDLAQFSLRSAVPADLRRIADELLVARLAAITLGERVSLARRSSAMVAAALLLDKESRVWQTALENPRLTEAAIGKTLQRPGATAGFVEAVSHHAKWSVRHEVRVALLRHPHTPLARALDFARHLPPAQLRDILHNSRLPEKIKMYLWKDLAARS